MAAEFFREEERPLPPETLTTQRTSPCDVIAAEPPTTWGVVFQDPNIITVHPITKTHACTGMHKEIKGIPFHLCSCGASFYVLADALNVLVNEYANKTE